jgi:hypothetical protein
MSRQWPSIAAEEVGRKTKILRVHRSMPQSLGSQPLGNELSCGISDLADVFEGMLHFRQRTSWSALMRFRSWLNCILHYVTHA